MTKKKATKKTARKTARKAPAKKAARKAPAKKKATKKPARKAPAKKKPAAKARKAVPAQKRPARKAPKAAPAKKTPARKARKVAPAKKRAPVKQKAFLAAYAALGNLSGAARKVKCNRSAHYKWMHDAAYAEAFAEAHAEACDALRGEARRRAVKGVVKPIYYQGDIVGTVKEYSDTLLIFLMKGAMPEEFRDNVKIEHDASAELIEALNAGRDYAAAAARRRDQKEKDNVVCQ